MGAAMDRAVDNSFQDSNSSDTAQLALWPEEAVHLLLFTCAKDPSIRIRRAVMSLLTSVVSEQQSAQEQAIVQTLALKCRDKDAKVQSRAFEMMVQLPVEALRTCLQVEDWRAVLDTALLHPEPDAHDSAANQHEELTSFGAKLLHKVLGTDKVKGSLIESSVLSAHINARNVVEKNAVALNYVSEASQYLQSLQLPWHNQIICQAYAIALSSPA